MVDDDINTDTDEIEVLAVAIPVGMAVLDTGCTASVVGEQTAKDYIEHFRAIGLPEPQHLQLPPVHLKGFNGVKSSTRSGLRWTVKIGELWGHVTTYVVPGEAPFLMSRKVLEGMEATLDLGQSTITSQKHGLERCKLSRASNGHLLLPLVPQAAQAVDTFEAASEPSDHVSDNQTADEPAAPPPLQPPPQNPKNLLEDKEIPKPHPDKSVHDPNHITPVDRKR